MGEKPRLRRTTATLAIAASACGVVASAPAAESSAASVHDAGRNGFVIDHVATREKVFFITVDDGSHLNRTTTQYIRNLHIPITTFALPEPLNHHRRRFLNLLRRTGMTFENHSQTHRSLSTMSYAAQRAEICAGNREIHRVINRQPVFLRPPGGAFDDDTIRAAKKCGISNIVLWNVVADYQHIVQARPGPTLKAGDIVLLHYLDSLPRSLDLVMRVAKKAGLRPALLRDYLLPAQTAETPTN